MPEWTVEYLTHNWGHVETFDPLTPVVVLKVNEPSTFACELPLGDTRLTANIIAPQRSDFRLWRDSTLILDGELKSVNLSGQRDTLECEHADWLQYLDERIYPFHYPFAFGDFPKKWTNVDLTTIVEDILTATFADILPSQLTNYSPPYIFNNALTGTTTNYTIDAGDSTTVLGHIKKLSEQSDGFDFKAKRDGANIRFTMTSPGFNTDDVPVYTITKDDEIGAGFEWTNTGPQATWTLGLGAGSQNKSRADESVFNPSVVQYRRRDGVTDFGEVRNLLMLQRLTGAEGNRQRAPQHTLNLPLSINTALLPNFWAQSLGRPYSLLGRLIHVGPINFRTYRTIDADYKILDMTIAPDQDGNEFVTFGLDKHGENE